MDGHLFPSRPSGCPQAALPQSLGIAVTVCLLADPALAVCVHTKQVQAAQVMGEPLTSSQMWFWDLTHTLTTCDLGKIHKKTLAQGRPLGWDSVRPKPGASSGSPIGVDHLPLLSSGH